MKGSGDAMGAGVPREAGMSPRGIVAQNLVYARGALGMTQQELAEGSGISRATIAQLEAGVGDPRLSTLELLAAVLRVPAYFLLLDQGSFRALAELAGGPRGTKRKIVGDAVTKVLCAGGGLSRQRAAALGVDAAREAGLRSKAQGVGAAIGAARLGDGGVVLGARWAELLERYAPAAGAGAAKVAGAGEIGPGEGI